MSKNAQIAIGAVLIIVFLAVIFMMVRGEESHAPSQEADTTDESLKNDAAAIDAELQGLEQDRATIDEGLETNVSAE